MTIELLYTSAAQGLKQGSRGFCTVVCTAGLPINLAQRLEALSGYRHLYQPGDVKADENPVCHSHIRLVVGGKTLSIVSRVAAYGVDYSQRTNKIAHHVVFDGSVPPCGPAAVLAQSTVMRATWDGECRTLASGPVVPPMSLQPAPCQHWQRMAGDAGWAGVVANAWLQPTGKPVWIIFSESQSKSLLMMMQEATALLPESRRWQATFSTYCTNLPPDVECRVRCVVAGSDEARMSIARGVVLDLTRPLGMAPESEAAEAARNGFVIGTKTTSIPSVATVPDKYEEPDDDFESAFAEGSSEEKDYGLQPQLPSVAPILIKSPKDRGKLKGKRVVADPHASSFTNRALILAVVGVAVFLSLFLGGAIWFASSNNIAGIVGNEPAPKEAKPELPTSPANPSKSGQQNEPEKASNKADLPPTTLPTKSNPRFSISQVIKEIDENKDINPLSEVASLTIENPDEIKFSVSVESEYFLYQDQKILFNPLPARHDFETTPVLTGKIKIEAEDSTSLYQETFAVVVKDLVENRLDFTVSDETGQKNPKIVFEGVRLIATMNQGSIDTNEKEPYEQSFVWKGRNGANDWTDFSTSSEVIIDSHFSEVYCELQYSQKSQSSNNPTKVRSEPINIYPVGKAEIGLSSILSGEDLGLIVEVSFPKLKVKEEGKYPFEWEKHDSYLLGNSLKVTHRLEVVRQTDSAVDLRLGGLKFVSETDSFKTRQLFHNVQRQHEAFQRSVEKLKSSVNMLKLVAEKRKVGRAVVQFVGKLEATPSEKLFESIEMVDEWLKQVVLLKRFAEENTAKINDNLISDSDNEIEQEQIKKQLDNLESQYLRVFPKSQLTIFPSVESKEQILGFANDWDFDWISKKKQFTQFQNQIRINLQSLVDSVQALRDAMRSLESLEFLLESTKEINIWPIATSTPTGGMATRNNIKDVLHRSMFRVRATVFLEDLMVKNSPK